MVNFCVNCGRKLSFSNKLLDGNILCNECRIVLDNKRREVVAEREAQENERRIQSEAQENERQSQLADV